MDLLVPIGRFSEMTRLTVKALRLYAESGLLPPAHVDPLSGYRYYRLGQANRAEAIRILRGVDMPLSEIAEVLATDEPELIRKQLDRHRDRLAARLADDERRLRFLERLIERGEGVMPYDVELKETRPETVATVRRHTDLAGIGAALDEGFATVVHAVGSAGGTPVGTPFVVYHAVIDEFTAGDIDICVPIAADVEIEGDVDRVDVPAQRVASTVHRGPYDELSPAYHTLTGWIAEHGHQMAGPPRERYLNDPREVPPEDLLTEVQWPVTTDPSA
ncbi:MAG TPA: MerR family transcriptional regulator [Euzebyales bacterium]